jgi:imidazole glycerol phosphate synthase subunit HisF
MVNITWHFIFKSGVELQVTKPSYEWLQKRKNLGVGEILIKGLKRSVRSLEQYGDNI